MEQKSDVQYRAEKEYKNSREKFSFLLREIISNSIHAVLIRQSKESNFLPKIELTIIFDDENEQCKIILTDNGEGFTDINRNYFDFRHDYLFDEIITDMPVRSPRVTRRDLDFIYGKFFEKSREVLTRNGIIVMYTNEIGLVKKNLRFHHEYRMLQDVPMQDRSDYHVVVLAVVM